MRWWMKRLVEATESSVEGRTRSCQLVRWSSILATVALLTIPQIISAVETGMLKINEVRADDDGTDDVEFVELIGLAGTDITGFEIAHYNGAETVDGGLWTHTIGSFTVLDDGITDIDGSALGFYVLGCAGFSGTGVDEYRSSELQNGPGDGIILYDSEGNILDAVAWDGAGDLPTDDPGTVTTSGGPAADNYLHVIRDDDTGDNSLQAPNNVLGDDGSGWYLGDATIGAINVSQTSGDISLPVTLSSFTAFPGDSRIILRWITESEIDNLGFNVYSSLKENGEYRRINGDLIQGAGSSAMRSEYSFTDMRLTNGRTYYYKLEDVCFDGKHTLHGPIKAIPKDASETEEEPKRSQWGKLKRSMQSGDERSSF